MLEETWTGGDPIIFGKFLNHFVISSLQTTTKYQRLQECEKFMRSVNKLNLSFMNMHILPAEVTQLHAMINNFYTAIGII